jgi:outer membrane protein assembly factor BamB
MTPGAIRRGARRAAAALAIGAAALAVGGCTTLSSWLPSIPPPSFGWLFGSSKKPGPLPEIKATVTPQLAWQARLGKAAPGFAPTVVGDAVYAAAGDGALSRIDRATGRSVWSVTVAKKLSAGAGADANLVAVGTEKGDVYAYDANGKALWQARVSSEVVSPPRVAEGLVVVWSGDGRVFGLAAADGKTKWVYQRATPPLTVRNFAGGIISRGGLLMGMAGGKLVALDLATGNVGWEANVATPKGATELERIADVTSLPIVEDRQVCAVAYQGRVACFELLRGNLNWSRDVSSLEGIVTDNRALFVVDEKGNVQALDKATGASIWKQDKLAARHLGGPQLVGDWLGVVDAEGYLHLLDRNDGTLVGRLATDGTPATSQPVAAGANALWQTDGGNLYSVSAR